MKGDVIMYSNLYRKMRLFYPGGLQKFRRSQELNKTEWFSPDELAAWQLPRLQHIVKYAYEHVPYYHEKYQQLGIQPDDIRSIKDIQSLPFLTRDDINNNLKKMVSPEKRKIAIPDATGGSTGQPIRFYRERAFSWWDNALEIRGRGWYGVSEGDKIAWIWGAARDMRNWNWKKRLGAKILREQYLNAFNMTEENMDSYAKMLIRWQPKMLRAYASALSLFAQYIQEKGITGIRPKLIETTAEKVTKPQRELFEETFNCPVVDWYTAREFGTIAFQCPVGSLHVVEPLYLEVIANDQPAQPGQMGEVVLTSTHQYAMPFIRYKLGDLAIYKPELCSCGRGLPVLSEVVGRTQDFLVTTNGLFVHGGFFHQAFRQWPEIHRYQVYQADKQHLDVRLVCKTEVDDDWLDMVHKEIKHRFGEEMNISINLVDDFKLTPAGKHLSVISDVKPDFIN